MKHRMIRKFGLDHDNVVGAANILRGETIALWPNLVSHAQIEGKQLAGAFFDSFYSLCRILFSSMKL